MTPKGLRIQIPQYFQCPISLDLMRDPVTLSTGQTYDRGSIEKWVQSGNDTCPATMQQLQDHTLIPNHTLRRLIQDWCVANRARGVERIPTPKQPADPLSVQSFIQDIGSCNRYIKLSALHNLRALAKDSERNKSIICEAGAVPVLMSCLVGDFKAQTEDDTQVHKAVEKTSEEVIYRGKGSCDRDRVFKTKDKDAEQNQCSLQSNDDDLRKSDAESTEEALAVLVQLTWMDSEKIELARRPDRLRALSCVLGSFLSRGSMKGRINAGSMVENLCSMDEFIEVVAATDGVMDGLVGLLRESMYPRAVKAGINGLLAICMAKKPRELAVKNGAAGALVELLVDVKKGDADKALATLELLCTNERGRKVVSEHALSVPVLVKMILKVSEKSTECAAGCLWSICSHSVSMQQSAMQAGVFTQLLLLIQSNCTPRAKRKARDLLKLLRTVWADDPCASHQFDRTGVTPF